MRFLTIKGKSDIWGSTQIRGYQILENAGSTLDSIDITIAIKCFLKNYQTTKPKFVDLIDSGRWIEEMSKDGWRFITITKTGQEYIQAQTDQQVVLLPQQHCNFKNELRTRKDISVVGYCGSQEGLNLDFDELTQQLLLEGFDFKWLLITPKVTRQDVVDFYKTIDINLAYSNFDRPPLYPKELRTPLKIINAGSFKIPTICYPSFIYVKECPFGSFLAAFDIDDIVTQCKNLRTGLYEEISGAAYEFSKQFHISNIIEQYKSLGKAIYAA